MSFSSSILYRLFHPTIDALLAPSLPFITRLRLLFLQPLNLLIHILNGPPSFLAQPPAHKVRHIPTRLQGSSQRCLIYPSPLTTSASAAHLTPLHVHIHGGAWIGGLPDYDHDFCAHIAQSTGAVVVSLSYRFAPRFPFPAAIDDVDDIFAWLVSHAEAELGADARLLTVSGFSAGANLALAAGQGMGRFGGVKGAVTFYAPVDLRIPPNQKPRPEGFPKFDPLGFIAPLYDAYAAPSRAAGSGKSDPRLNPILASVETLPEEILMVVPKIDILVDEQEKFFQRVKREVKEWKGEGTSAERRVERLVFEKGFHGWLELPTFIVGDKDKKMAFAAASGFIHEIHKKHGFDMERTQVR